MLPVHYRYREYTDEELEGFLRAFPNHADRQILCFEIERRQKEKQDQKADKRHQQSEGWHRETRRRADLAIAVSILGVIVSIGSLALAYLANKPIPKHSPSIATERPSTSLPSPPPSRSSMPTATGSP